MRIILHIILILALTVLTQIGGVVYLFSILIIRRKKVNFRVKRVVLFFCLYVLSIFLIVPNIAPFFGREKVKNTQQIDSQFFVTWLFNRNYVTPEMNQTLKGIANKFQGEYPDSQLIYLDANFPFFDGFPLLPHLSHNDGKKLDLAFIYKEPNGQPTNKKPSNSGYGIFENPRNKEINQTEVCKRNGSWQYDFPKYLTFGSDKELELDSQKTRRLIELIAQHSKTQKIFIEPHLKKDGNLTPTKSASMVVSLFAMMIIFIFRYDSLLQILAF